MRGDQRATITINGIETPIKSWSFETNDPLRYERTHPLPEIALGRREITGTLEVRFENEALLAAFWQRDAELDAFLRGVLLKPHKANAWATAVPYLRRLAIAALIVAASLAFTTGVT